MSVGLPVTKSEVDARMGDTARAVQKLFQDIQTVKSYLDRTDDQTLDALGFTQEEVGIIRSAWNDLAQFGRIGMGLEALPDAKDFRVFVQQLWGVGSF